MKFTIRVTHDKQGQFGYESAEDAFWKPILASDAGRSSSKENIESTRKAELHLTFELPDFIRKGMLRHAEELITAWDRQKSVIWIWYRSLFTRTKYTPKLSSKGMERLTEIHHEIYQANISISEFRYGSLLFDIDISPIEKCMEFYENNYEYFRYFLGIYVRDCFEAEFTTGRYLVETSQASSAVTASEGTSAIGNTSPTDNTMATSKSDSARFAWQLANGSLLIPVLLAVGLLYLYQNRLDNLSEMNYRKLELILEQQDKLITRYAEESQASREIEKEIIEKYLNNPCCIKKPVKPTPADTTKRKKDCDCCK